MRYWLLHIIIILIVVFFWMIQTQLQQTLEYEAYSTSPQLDSVIVDVDTVLNKTITEKKIKLVPPPNHTVRMMRVEPVDTSKLDTLQYPMSPPPAPLMIEEEPTYITKRDVKVDTVYRYVYEIQQPIITETPPQPTSILDNINILVTIFGGLLNIIILGFQLRDRKSK